MKKSAKITAFALALAFGSIAPTTASATGIPVFDGAAAAQDALKLAQLVEQVAKSAIQIDNQVKQIQELQSQVKALTGSRNMGKLLENVAKSQIPDEWKSIYENLSDVNFEEIINSKSYKPETSLQLMVDNLNQAEKAITETKQSFEQLDQLLQQIDQAPDMKAAADLQNRISIEQARIANNQTKLDMMERMYALNERIEAKRYDARVICEIENNGDLTKCD